MKQYGGSRNGAIRQFANTLGSETSAKVYDAMNEAFPDILTYQQAVMTRVKTRG
jgi:hypothetical protein